MSNKQSSQSTGSDSSENSDGEEQDESSSKQGEDGESSLTSFRHEWQKELRELKYRRTNSAVSFRNVTEINAEESDEIKARKLFLKGIEMERSKKMYEAIQFYRRAVQLVPDIEFRLEELKTKARNDTDDDKKQDHSNLLSKENNEDTDIDSEDEATNHLSLLQRIEGKVNKSDYLCSRKNEQKGKHISELPTEILLYILRWVVSSDLDLRSLEMFSQTCRGFYLCARDPKIWKLACERAWGLNCGILTANYESWRQMFLERAKLHFNGCYISKITYIRQGESSFQDQFYRPWHVVTFYRYFRFFPEGLVYMLTTPDEPSQCIGLLKTRQAKIPSILKGHYRLKENTVTMVLHRQENVKSSYRKNQRRGSLCSPNQSTYHLELKIRSQNRKKHVQLAWEHFSIYTCNKSGAESRCTFDLVGNNFPPFWFSRVKSYTAESEQPLQ